MKKGISTPVALAIVLVLAMVSIFSVVTTLSLLTVTPEVTYDGEFDDGYLATKSFFYSDFSETEDCNITSDVLGGSGYSSCIYETTTNALANSNSTDMTFSWAFKIDGYVKDLNIEANLQNTGTGQARDDYVIKTFKLYTYEDDPVLVRDFTESVEDNVELDVNTGVLEGDVYALYVVLHTKTVSPNFADGDDIMRIDLDLDTSGDVDAARVTLEAG